MRILGQRPIGWLCATWLATTVGWAAQPVLAQVLPPTAQPGFAQLSQDLGASSAVLSKDAAVLTVPNHTVTLRHKPGPPWFSVTVVPDSPDLRERVEQALPRYFARDPWYLPPPPVMPPRPMLARLPDVRTTPRWHAVASTLALLLLAGVGLVVPLRRPKSVQPPTSG